MLRGAWLDYREDQMTAYSEQALEQMLSDLESDLAERKESFNGDVPTKAREAICAFANDLPDRRQPGVLFIGAKDDGSPSGLVVTDELLRQLADMKTDGSIVPPPTLTVAKHVLYGHEMAIVIVWPADSPPVRYKGRVYIRIGPRRGIASAQDERILSEKRRHQDRSFDVRPAPSASLADLDRRRFEDEYLPAAFASDVLAANERSYEQRLAATKMVVAADEPTPTVLGVLALSTRTRDFIPGAYVQFLRIAGRELADPVVDEQLIDGPLSEVLRRTDEKLAAHNRVNVDLTSEDRERRTYLYPPAALQQIVRNAVMHRSYEATNAPVRVTWYDDRVEISSPGGPFGAVTVENFGQPGVADYRNPGVAEALRVLGFVQRFGVGIATARRELAENGNPPPEFEVNQSYVGVTLKPAP
jgi:ATP-dependent DNA helicase RecG